MIENIRDKDALTKNSKEYNNFEMDDHTAGEWVRDPKHLLFKLSRYKFVSKMFDNYESVLEIGSSDCFGTYIVKQAVKHLVATDMRDCNVKKNKMPSEYEFEFHKHNILDGNFPGSYSGIYALDVMEHISVEKEELFLKNIIKSLNDDGVLILGMPSQESQIYASKESIEGHVNCKSGLDFRNLMKKYFHNVFLFSMNDEVVHTGFNKMAHYLFTVSCMKK